MKKKDRNQKISLIVILIVILITVILLRGDLTLLVKYLSLNFNIIAPQNNLNHNYLNHNYFTAELTPRLTDGRRNIQEVHRLMHTPGGFRAFKTFNYN